jgi:hypothetical protein
VAGIYNHFGKYHNTQTTLNNRLSSADIDMIEKKKKVVRISIQYIHLQINGLSYDILHRVTVLGRNSEAIVLSELSPFIVILFLLCYILFTWTWDTIEKTICNTIQDIFTSNKYGM